MANREKRISKKRIKRVLNIFYQYQVLDKYTYLDYHISMNVNLVKTLLEQGNGTLLASNAHESGITRQQLAYLTKAGILERAERGVYTVKGGLEDSLYALQVHSQKIIYSHETALFLHCMTDRTPNHYSVTVPSNYKPSTSIRNTCRIYYISPSLLTLGAISLPSGMGHQVTTYNKERTLCDIIRSRNRLDEQLLLDAVKNYALQSDKNLNRLSAYAKQLGVFKLVYHYLEVLL
jgi:predicted transcriptional regulator of viral defense system